jgi:hypothetical protein
VWIEGSCYNPGNLSRNFFSANRTFSNCCHYPSCYYPGCYYPGITVQHLQTETKFNRIIFSDEKKFRWDGPDGWRSYWAGIDERDPPALFSKDYNQYHGVMVWAGMSSEGVLHVERVQGMLDAAKFSDMVCGDALASIHAVHGTDFVLQQDNAAPHRAALTRETLKACGVEVMEWPSLSPDLNPVENLWSIIVRNVYSDGRSYSSDEELWVAVKRAALAVPKETAQCLVEDVRKRLLKVLELQGKYVQG